MKRLIGALLMVFGFSVALAVGSVALRGGYAGAWMYGVEASLDGFFQPPIGSLQATLDLGYAGEVLRVEAGPRYLISLPLLEGIRFGGGAGLGYAGGFFGFARGDAEFDLDVGTLPLPAFLGLDAGYAVALEKGAFEGVFAALKLGLRF